MVLLVIALLENALFRYQLAALCFQLLDAGVVSNFQLLCKCEPI